MNQLISVIIPVYNVDPYLRRCLDSVLMQSYRNIEVLLIDDGSTDDSGKICDEYASIDSRIKVIHKMNEGLSVARNVGLEFAHGQWIAFLDSDDWIEPDMYYTLLKLAQDNKCLISSCNSRNCIIGDSLPEILDDDTVILLDLSAMIRALPEKRIMRFEVWNKLWHRDLIGETRFIPGQVSEDIHFDRILFLRAKSIVHINKTLHNYTVNRPGSTATTFKVNRMCVFEEFSSFIDDIQDATLKKYIANLALKFAVNMYNEAFWSKYDKKLRFQLLENFHKFYMIADGFFVISKMKVLLFKLSPLLFCIVSKLRTKYYKSYDSKNS